MLPKVYVNIIVETYKWVSIRVRCLCGEIEHFSFRIGIKNQSLALCPYLFSSVMDKITVNIQDEVPWSVLIADDIAPVKM